MKILEMGLNIDVSSVFRRVNQALTEEDIKMMNPQSLAFIGDGVYELLIRTWIIDGDLSNTNMHRISSKYVNARAQRHFYETIRESLTDKELAIVNRGKNSKLYSVPKNADLTDYRWATGLEALFGYLYLMGEDDRILEIFNIWRENEG